MADAELVPGMAPTSSAEAAGAAEEGVPPADAEPEPAAAPVEEPASAAEPSQETSPTEPEPAAPAPEPAAAPEPGQAEPEPAPPEPTPAPAPGRAAAPETAPAAGGAPRVFYRGQTIDVATCEDGLEKGAVILGPSTDGSPDLMNIKFADGVTTRASPAAARFPRRF